MTQKETPVQETHKRRRRVFVLAAASALLWGCTQQPGETVSTGGDSPVKVHVSGFLDAGAMVH
jgi:hypothetical protein